MSKVKEILKTVFDFIRYKIGIQRLVALVIAIVLVVNIGIAIVLTSSVFGKDGLADSKKADKIIDIYLSDNKHYTWIKGKAKPCAINGENGNKLNAMLLSNYETSHSYVIVCHPFSAMAIDMATYAYHFYDLGFNVYLPEARGYGESKYKKTTLGYEEYKDIIKWVDYIVESDEDAKIFIFGVGMGGTSALLTADKNLPENVKGIIADCPYSDLNDLFKHNIKELYNLPSFPVVQLASAYNKLANGWSFSDFDVKESVVNAQVPLLFIQAGEDQVVPAAHINDLYDITTERNSEYLFISGAGHCETLKADYDKYWNSVDTFILNTIDL